jgi:HD superfamily phosphodiesterase
MKEIFYKIQKLALPYQDLRDDTGHAEVTLKYAQELVQIEGGDEDIIIPAIILHDIGWSQMIKGRRILVFARSAREEDKLEVQMEHQQGSVKLASEILHQVNYPEELIPEILEIIAQHDTRKGFISKNEGLVRDADKLWRTSKEGVATAQARAVSPESLDEAHWKKLEENMNKPDYFYSQTAHQIAFADLRLRKQGK